MATATAVKLSDKKAKVYEGSKDPRRAAYYEKISQSDMAPLWEVLKDLVTKEPKASCVPLPRIRNRSPRPRSGISTR